KYLISIAYMGDSKFLTQEQITKQIARASGFFTLLKLVVKNVSSHILTKILANIPPKILETLFTQLFHYQNLNVELQNRLHSDYELMILHVLERLDLSIIYPSIDSILE